MKLKEKILKEFEEKFLISGDFLIRAYPYDVKEFLFKALDSMREETLREVEEKLDGLDCGFCNYEKEVKLRLNKLKTKNEKKR